MQAYNTELNYTCSDVETLTESDIWMRDNA